MSTPRLLTIALGAMLAFSACTDDSPAGGTSSTTVEADSTTTVGPEYALSYSYRPGQALAYDVDLHQDVVLTTEGSAAAVDEGQVPGSADVTIDATGVFTFTVSDGPEAGTFSVAIDGTFDDVAVEGTADGEEVDDAAALDQLGVLEPVSATVVVDERGRIVEDQAPSADPFGLGGSPLAGLSGDLGQLVGPVLPEDPVTVSEEWTEETQASGMGDQPVETSVTASITGTEQVEGRETVVIEATSRTGRSEVDLSAFFAGFMGAFADPDDTPTQNSMQELVDQLVFRIITEPATASSTTWFDPEEGVAVRSTTSGPTSLQMEASLPDEETGELQSFELKLEVDQSLEYRLR